MTSYICEAGTSGTACTIDGTIEGVQHLFNRTCNICCQVDYMIPMKFVATWVCEPFIYYKSFMGVGVGLYGVTLILSLLFMGRLIGKDDPGKLLVAILALFTSMVGIADVTFVFLYGRYTTGSMNLFWLLFFSYTVTGFMGHLYGIYKEEGKGGTKIVDGNVYNDALQNKKQKQNLGMKPESWGCNVPFSTIFLVIGALLETFLGYMLQYYLTLSSGPIFASVFSFSIANLVVMNYYWRSKIHIVSAIVLIGSLVMSVLEIYSIGHYLYFGCEIIYAFYVFWMIAVVIIGAVRYVKYTEQKCCSMMGRE
jgi:hypothetical protein